MYEKANLAAIVAKQDQLTLAQQAALLALLTKHENVFQGKHGNWKGE